MFIKSAVLAIGVASVAAGPVYRRQESTAVGSSAAPATITGTEAASSAVESASTVVSSVLSSVATATSSAPEVSATAPTDGNVTFSGCPAGYSLTYVVGTAEYPEIQLETLTSSLSNWATTVPAPIMVTESQGSSEAGATRTWTALNLTVMEELVNVTMDMTTGSLNQQWNLTMPVQVTPAVTISNATSDFTIYSNSTSNITSAQLYVNFCVNDQQAGLALYAQLAQIYLSGLPALASGNTTDPAASTSMAPTDSASSAASSATDSAASGVEGATSTAISGASGAASTAISGVTGVAGTVTSAVGGALSTALSGVTGILPTRV